MANSKEARQLVDESRRQGFRVQETKNGWMCYPPDGSAPITVHRTPSDQRAWNNTLARFRRAGLAWPPPKK